MRKERCLHTNISSEPGIKLSEYTGNGTPACISNFLNCEKHHSNASDDELKPIQSFIDKIPIPVFYKNIEGKYSGCNKAFIEFIGESDPSSQIAEFKQHKEVVENNCTNEMELLQTNGSRICESIIKRKNGEIKYTLINKATITNEKGEACGLIGMISDITTNRLLKDALNTPAGNTEISRDEHFQQLTNIKQLLFDENKKRRRLEKKLAQASRKIEDYIKKHAESNIAMKTILEYQENYKKEIEDNLISNVRHLVIPYILKLKRNRVSSDDLNCLKMIESKLDEIVSPLSNKLSSRHTALTPREIQIADLIKDGMQDKDIMEVMNIAIDTVKTHRKNIRRKLGIYGDRSNLRSTLLSLSS
jgi:DNA-binding CsgD family transcriptional regulator